MRLVEPFIHKGLKHVLIMDKTEDGYYPHSRSETEWRKSGTSKEEAALYDDIAVNNRWALPTVDLNDFDTPFPSITEIATRIIRYLRRYIYLRDDRQYETLAAWVISTYFRDQLYYAPLVIFDGLTISGKSTAIYTLNQIVYRGEIFDSASGPAIAREIQDYGTTILLDEVLDGLSTDRGMDLYSLLKSCFFKEGTWIRADPKGRRNFRYSTYTTCALTIRGENLPSDLANRAIKINMTAAPSSADLKDIYSWREDDSGKEDSPDTIRDDLYRLMVLTVCQPNHEKALHIKKYQDDAIRHMKERTESGTWYYAYINGMPKDSPEIGSRDRNIASTLYAIGLATDMERPIIETIIANAAARKEEVADTLESLTFTALLELVKEEMEKKAFIPICNEHFEESFACISTSDVALRVNDILMMQGNASRDPIPTKTITAKLAALGMKYRRFGGKGQNKSWMNPEDDYCIPLFLSHTKTYCPEQYPAFKNGLKRRK